MCIRDRRVLRSQQEAVLPRLHLGHGQIVLASPFWDRCLAAPDRQYQCSSPFGGPRLDVLRQLSPVLSFVCQKPPPQGLWDLRNWLRSPPSSHTPAATSYDHRRCHIAGVHQQGSKICGGRAAPRVGHERGEDNGGASLSPPLAAACRAWTRPEVQRAEPVVRQQDKDRKHDYGKGIGPKYGSSGEERKVGEEGHKAHDQRNCEEARKIERVDDR